MSVLFLINITVNLFFYINYKQQWYLMNYNCCIVYVIQGICMRLGMRNNHMDLRDWLWDRTAYACERTWERNSWTWYCVWERIAYAWDRKWERNIDMRLTVKESIMYEAYREKKHIGVRVCTVCIRLHARKKQTWTWERTAYMYETEHKKGANGYEKELHMHETVLKKKAYWHK